LAESGIDAGSLELELTESMLISDTESVLATVRRLKAIGVKLSIDDFGTGYSSLAYLKRFNVDRLKIDQSFVRDLVSSPDDAAIVRAIIQLAKSLDLRTIAEGVEHEDQYATLRQYGCDEVQGYFLARPMPAADLTVFLDSRRA
jgi:EAL domain-containing protein (putative c-di-GMP-specific phosphodiesterase class I)